MEKYECKIQNGTSIFLSIGWIGLCLYAVIICCCFPIICCAGLTALLFPGPEATPVQESAKDEKAKDEEEKVGMTKSEAD